MSWWNSSNLTSFASQALKTAQKRIDKVLDISEEGGSPDASIPTPKQNVDAPKSPDSTKNEPDGDNFWSAWLGDGSEKKGHKEEETTSEIVDSSLTKKVTSGFKSERAKSKVEEAIMFTSTKSLQIQKQEKSEETDAAITTTSTVTTVTTEKMVSSTSGKRSSPLKLTSKLGKKKSEKPEKAKEDKRSSNEDGNIQGPPGAISDKCEAPGDSQDGNLGQDEADSSDIKLKGSTGESQIEAQDTALAITDMVSSVSDGWTVEGWAADGQLEDLLQTSLMQQMEEEEEVKASGGEKAMTRSLSSSSAVTVQDLEPSLVVVADSEEIENKTEVTSEVMTEVITEVMTDVATAVTTEDQAVSEPEKSSEIAQTETANQAENTVSVPSENDTDDMKDVATEETAANLLASESSESADLPHDDEQHTEESESNELATDVGSADVGISQDAIQEAHISEESVADTSAPISEEMVAGSSETFISTEPAEEFSPDADVKVESNEEVKDVSNDDVEDQQIIDETPCESEESDPIVAVDTTTIETINEPVAENMQLEDEGSPEVIEENRPDSQSCEIKDNSDDEVSEKVSEIDTSDRPNEEPGDVECPSDVVRDESEVAPSDETVDDSSIDVEEAKKSDLEVKSEEDLVVEGVEKKSSVWVEEMCQLKDSITSTTASDELSDSNRTITSEDVGELSIDVSEQGAELQETQLDSEGGTGDLEQQQQQQDQMTLKVVNAEMVSSTVSSSGSLVKNLEDAMVESMKDNDSHSTTSTEKSSEMVRIESGGNSGHTSGDEIETTTSSDIEIISTPNSNGEYKLERPFEFSPLRYALSRTVRHSPPGHKRSDSSSSGQSNWSKNGDDMLSPEGGIHTLEEHWPMVKEEEDGGDPVESKKLLKRLGDMAEILDAREKKLMELSRESIDLQEANNILRTQLQQSEEAREVEMSDLTTLTEEFTKRLSEAEKKYTTLARERDGLKRQLKDTETILARRSDNSVAVEKLMKEKDLQIAELLAEGEKLSKQQLQSNNIIKKLRNKEKENETLIKSQNQKIESEGAELEHLRKVLDVKEDLEKKQIEAINQLNNRVKKQEIELGKTKSETEDYEEKIRSMQVTLDNSYKEIAELHKKSATKASEAQEARLSVELTAKEELRLSLERHQYQARQENEALIQQIEDLRLSLTRMEKEHSRKEDVLRQEVSDLQQRLQEGENRNQELTEGVTAATRPLLRQIENLQSTYAAQSASFERVERNLTERLAEANAQLATAQEKERNASEKFMEISTRLKGLESQVSILRQEKSTLSAQLEMERAKVEALEDTRHSDLAQLEGAKVSLEKNFMDVKKQVVLLENQLEMEKMKVESEKKKVQFAQDTLKEKELEMQLQQSLRVSPEVSLMTKSRAASLSRESSFHESMSSSLVMQEDGMEKSFLMVSPNGNKMSLYETLRQTGASTLIENLQSQLKLREGEISQLQSDISELEKTRESMARELVNVSNEKETLESQVQELGELRTKFTELDNRYNALLMMYGEKVEEAEELKLDLQDVKDMYKAQIEELVNKR